MILIIDNYDSFTYNLVHVIGGFLEAGDIRVVRNDAITVEEIERLNPSHIIISPGPGYPKDAGISKAAIKNFYRSIPILGVCLGHQAICEVFGGDIVHARQLMHGKQSEVELIAEVELFEQLADRIKVARYHSLIADERSLPQELSIISKDCKNGEIMAVKHNAYPVYGVQFHPESILTPDGEQMLKNFIAVRGGET